MPADGALRRYLGFEKRPGENPWLDLLRCAAIGLVLARHGHRAWLGATGAEPARLDFLLLNGWIGVDLFLVLSGYLVGGILLRDEAAVIGHRLPVYFRRRALRILPAYYAVLLATVSGAFPLYDFSRENLGLRLLYHLAMLQDYFTSDINVVFWSIGTEIKFYFLAPFVVLLALRARSPAALLGLLGAFVLASTAMRWGMAFDRGVPADYGDFVWAFRHPLHAVGEPLMLGVSVALLERRGLLGLGPRAAGWLLAGVAAAAGALAASHDFLARITMYDVVGQPLLIALLCAAAVAAGAALTEIRMPLESVARIVARLAYALYLVHFPLLPLALALAFASGGSAAAYWTIFLGLSLASALAVHYLCEKPFLTVRPQFPLRARRAA